MSKTSVRYGYLDRLRMVGCLAVVLLHVSSRYTLEAVGSFNYWIGLTFDSLSQFAVPLFVMISGALFLDERYDYSLLKTLGHVKKLLIFFFGWSVIFCMVFTVLKTILLHGSITPMGVISSILSGPYHLWYIPMLIGLYLITPLLRLWVTEANRKQVEYFLILGFLFNVLLPEIKVLLSYAAPEYLEAFNVTDGLVFHYSLGYVMYFVLGWYLHTFEIRHKTVVFVAGVISAATAVVGTYGLTVWKQNTHFFFNNFSLSMLLYSVSVFVFVKSRYAHVSQTGRFVNSICRHSMGIYAMHTGVFPIFTYILTIDNAAVAVPVEFAIACLLPLLASVVLKKLPILNRLV